MNISLDINIHEYLRQMLPSLFYWDIYSKLNTAASLNAKIGGVSRKVAGLLKRTAARPPLRSYISHASRYIIQQVHLRFVEGTRFLSYDPGEICI